MNPLGQWLPARPLCGEKPLMPHLQTEMHASEFLPPSLETITLFNFELAQVGLPHPARSSILPRLRPCMRPVTHLWRAELGTCHALASQHS